MCKKIMQFFAKRPVFNAVVHGIAGIGIGIIIARPIAGTHPLRWGLILLLIGVLGHLYPIIKKK